MDHTDLYYVLGSTVIVAATFLCTEFLSRLIRTGMRIAGASQNLIRNVRDTLRLLAIAIAVSAILSFTGLASEFTALTISGVAGVAVSLALQNTLSNIIAGILLIRDGVIRIGDRIEYGGSLKGEVVKVALRNAWIKTDDGAIAVVSNSNLSSGPLVNRTATERLKKKLGIDD